jgi:hypothetical protein
VGTGVIVLPEALVETQPLERSLLWAVDLAVDAVLLMEGQVEMLAELIGVSHKVFQIRQLQELHLMV